MKIYIALLRGINVGGKNIIKMAELKKMFENIGYTEVTTYIQSGNVLFHSDEEEEIIQRNVERAIEETFGISAAVILRSKEEMNQIARNCPFTGQEIEQAESYAEGESLYVAMLPNAPLPEKFARLDAYQSDTDRYRSNGRDIYLLFSKSIRNSKLANNLHKLDEPATVRNWKTITKLNELAEAMKNMKRRE